VSRFTLDSSRARELVAQVSPDGGGTGSALSRYATIVWSCLVEPGDSIAGALVTGWGSEQALRAITADTVDPRAAEALGVTASEFRRGLARWHPRLDDSRVVAAVVAARTSGARLLTPDDAEWPHRLDDLGLHAPLCLWVRGSVAAVAAREPFVALVGARAASSYGEHIAGEIAAELAVRGVSVVSGAAYGIDGAAHRAALGVGGTTIALLAGGVDRAYPAGHTRLLEQIAAQGAIASEVPCGSSPTRWRFLQRNRLIAALADATVVVEAGWRSGSLNTAGHAAALGRPLGAVPGPVTSAASAGCHRLLREFDARCITSADDTAELLGLVTRVGSSAGDAHGDARTRTDDRTRVTDALSFRAWREVDDIARRCGMAPDDIVAHLGLLALEGSVCTEAGRWRRVATAGAGPEAF